MFELPWLPPYDWRWMFGFLQARAVAGIECFHDQSYTRSWGLGPHHGLITMTPDPARQVLRVTLSAGLLPVADEALRSTTNIARARNAGGGKAGVTTAWRAGRL